jgi:hypothetical protein
MGSEIQPGVRIVQKREIKKNIFSVKKYTSRNFYMELRFFFAIIQ